MKIVLSALNSKFVHTSLALRSIAAYTKKYGREVEISEYTINNEPEKVVADLYIKNADIYGFSLYVFNKEETLGVISDLKKLRPDAIIFCGGPEASESCEKLLREYPSIDFLLRGEGEKADLLFFEAAENAGCDLEKIKEAKPLSMSYFLNGKYVETERVPLIENLDDIPFPYTHEELCGLKERILYYEGSRGCPFSCSYCMSSLDKKVRVFSVERVKKDIDEFLSAEVRLVKFVDRTFNFDKKRTYDLLSYIMEKDNGITEFHFEISLWLLDDKTVALLQNAREGLFRFEIGIQTGNKKTLEAINRKADVFDYSDIFEKLRKTKVHLHTDLIAGLPYENMESFLVSLDRAYLLGGDCLQLGFLKVLHGTEISTRPEFEITTTDRAPYEILKTKWLSYGDILTLKKAENILEILYNGGLMKNAFDYAVREIFSGKVSSLLLFLSKKSDETGFFAAPRKPRDIFAFFAGCFSRKDYPELFEKLAFDYFTADLYSGEETFLPTLPDMKKAQALLHFPEEITNRLDKNAAELFRKKEPKKWLRNTKVVRISGKDIVFFHLPRAVSFEIDKNLEERINGLT